MDIKSVKKVEVAMVGVGSIVVENGPNDLSED